MEDKIKNTIQSLITSTPSGEISIKDFCRELGVTRLSELTKLLTKKLKNEMWIQFGVIVLHKTRPHRGRFLVWGSLARELMCDNARYHFVH